MRTFVLLFGLFGVQSVRKARGVMFAMFFCLSSFAAEPAFVGASDSFRGEFGDDNDNKAKGWLWETAILNVEEGARVRLDGWFIWDNATMAIDFPDGSREEYPLIDKQGPEVDRVADHAGLWKIEVRVRKKDAGSGGGWGVEWSTLRAVGDASPCLGGEGT